ncbi:hypothetical protein [Acetoanaerobium noterae]|uniref:hypothetical protein n=1 Tax=Acetoanaerobium noterae TaxID=745369 RepID=UPI00331C6D82
MLSRRDFSILIYPKLLPKVSKNRINIEVRKHPCPERNLDDIRTAFKHFGMI